ncbi:efflux RND transporter periplasmic adaptor subunit [Dyella sp.]|jgi:membrane fusion protein (multidrug efflux system)|uniref:efflux RND transporter periplasmic adaptor subunit n=1 Tax=Dyella sp. TaxID=1869338 RepID=UPI002D772563|nr:efflux RND transporter periplasmic adaptor subunit [Dyella sp.]HET6433138.1 efflux RND transporter periplasmic adaptor subunit [Dyella sp.]
MNPSSLRTPLLCLGLLALAACGGKDKSPPAPPPPTVGVITATPTSTPLTKDLVGRLSPFRSADVRARVSGVVLKRTYDEGSDVKKGQVLFQIDPAPLKASLDAAQANLAQARASYTNAKVAAQRVRELAPKGYVSKSDLDNAEATERSAQASVQQAQANVQTARINLGYATVTSPIDGRAGKQQVTEGALVGQGEATLLTTVDQIDPLYVNFTLGASELEQMRQAQAQGNLTLADPNTASVAVSLPDGSAYPHQGTVNFADMAVNPATGSVDLRATVPNPEHRLLPGMYVTLKAKLGEQHRIFLIPQPALQRDTTGAYVLVVGKDGKVARKDVTAEQVSGSNWVVSDGLAASDKVIVSGLQSVKDGAPAKTEPWTPADRKTPGDAQPQPATSAGKASAAKQ